MSARTRERATYEDVVRAPEHMVAELIDGELFLSPRPKPRHLKAASRLGMRIGSAFDLGNGGPGGWVIWDEPELHLDENVLVPDLGGWRVERLPEVPDTAGIDIPPDWICEVRSPSTGRLDRLKKMPIYAAHGVKYAWIIDPIDRTLEVFQLENGRWTVLGVHGGNQSVSAEPFEEIVLDLTILWGREPEDDDSPATP